MEVWSTVLSKPHRLLRLLGLLLFAAPASAQIADRRREAPQNGLRYGPPETIRFRVGAEITASRGACRGIVAMVTVPLECPEQQVSIVDEDFSPEVGDVTYRTAARRRAADAHLRAVSAPTAPRPARSSRPKLRRGRSCRPRKPTI